MDNYEVDYDPRQDDEGLSYFLWRDGTELGAYRSEEEAWEAAGHDEAGYYDHCYEQLRDERMGNNE